MIRVTAHVSISALEQRMKVCRDATAARHVQVIWLLAQGHISAQVSALTAFSQRWIQQVLERYNAEGPDTSGDLRRRNGRPTTILTPVVLDALRRRLAEPPPDGGSWSCRKVSACLAEQLGVETVSVQLGWEALQAIGWSLQRPRPKNPRSASDEEAAAFKKKLADTLAEETAAHPDTPVEVDATNEHRIGLKPVMRSAWAPTGERPIALGHHRFKWLYVIAFVAPSTGDTKWYLSNGVSKPFFEKLLRANPFGSGSEGGGRCGANGVADKRIPGSRCVLAWRQRMDEYGLAEAWK